MNTETLIATLAKDVAPAPRRAVERRLLLAMLGGSAITLILVAQMLASAEIWVWQCAVSPSG